MKKIFNISFLVIIFIFIGYLISIGKYKLPVRVFSLSKIYPTQCEVYIGSDGEFYYALDGYYKTIFGETTAEKAIEAAQDALDHMKEKDSRGYRLIFARGLN